nr:AsmA family protein [Phyllobacterium sp. YR531]
MARLFVFIGGLLVLLLTAALIVPYFVDWAGYRSSFEREASALLGRPVTVAGTASARLLPFPSVTFSDVRVGDPGVEPVMTIENFSMDAELAPFLRGEILIFDMRLEKPTATVRINEGGIVDWAIRPRTPFQRTQVKLENLRINNGSVVIRDASTGTTRSISELNATMSAEDLSGPWKFDGSLFFNGEKMSVSSSTGALKADGSLQMHARVIPDSIPATMETDGQITLDQGALKYAGRIDIRSRDELVVKPGEKTDRAAKPLLSSVRLSGQFEADHARITIPEFRMEQGPVADPYVVNGTAHFDYGNDPRFEVKADGQQVTFGSQEQQQANVKASPETTAQRLGIFRRLMDQLPVPSVPGKIDLKLPAIVAGDTTIRSVTIDAAPVDGNWAINQLKAELPGRTQFEAKGVLQVGNNFGFDGKLLLASRQPSGLAAWLTDSVDDAIRRIRGAGFSGDVSLHDELQKVDNFELALGGASLKGSLVRSAKGDSLPLTQLKLEGGALDADALQAFSALFSSNASDTGAAILSGQDLDVDLKAGPVTHDGFVAETVDTAFRLRDGIFDIDRMTIGNLAGTTITATGKLEPFKAEPSGSIDATLLSDDMAPFIDILAQRFPDFPFLVAMKERASRFPGLFEETQLSVLANTLQGKAGANEFSLSAAGKTGGMNITLSGTNKMNEEHLRTLELTMNARTDHAEGLMAFIGLPALPLGLAGELEADIALKGNQNAGFQTQLALKAPDGRALLDGSFRYAGDGLSGEGRASIKSTDIDAYLATAGYSVPGFGNGTPVDAASSFSLNNGKLMLPDLSGQVSDTKIGGRLGFMLENGVPNAQGDLTLGRLNLDAVTQFVLGSGSTDGDGKSEWPKQPFLMNPLFPMGFDLKLRAEDADAGLMGDVRNFQTTASLKDGSLRLDDTKGDVFGGKLEGMFELRNTSGTGLATGQFTLDQVAIDELYRPESSIPPVKGKARISASINATGTSMAELVGSIAGSGVMSVNDLAVNSLNPGALIPVLANVDAVEGPITTAAIDTAINKYLNAGVLNTAASDIPYTIAGGVARTSTFQLTNEDARLSADLRISFPEMTIASQGKFIFEPGKAVVVGADPMVELTIDGPWAAPVATFNRQPLEQFLTQRALEREQQRVETLQASLVEKQRLRRETLLFQGLADERVRVARLKLEQEAREAAERKAAEEAARKEAEEAARKAIETPPAENVPPTQPQGAINRQSVDEFLKTIEPTVPQ